MKIRNIYVVVLSMVLSFVLSACGGKSQDYTIVCSMTVENEEGVSGDSSDDVLQPIWQAYAAAMRGQSGLVMVDSLTYVLPNQTSSFRALDLARLMLADAEKSLESLSVDKYATAQVSIAVELDGKVLDNHTVWSRNYGYGPDPFRPDPREKDVDHFSVSYFFTTSSCTDEEFHKIREFVSGLEVQYVHPIDKRLRTQVVGWGDTLQLDFESKYRQFGIWYRLIPMADAETPTQNYRYRCLMKSDCYAFFHDGTKQRVHVDEHEFRLESINADVWPSCIEDFNGVGYSILWDEFTHTFQCTKNN